MTRIFLTLPLAAALAMALSACGRDEDRLTTPVDPQLPRSQQNAATPAEVPYHS